MIKKSEIDTEQQILDDIYYYVCENFYTKKLSEQPEINEEFAKEISIRMYLINFRNIKTDLCGYIIDDIDDIACAILKGKKADEIIKSAILKSCKKIVDEYYTYSIDRYLECIE